MVFSACALFSILELTQAVYDRLSSDGAALVFTLGSGAVVEAAQSAAGELSARVVGRLAILSPDEVAALVDEITAFYRDEDAVCRMLEETTAMYGPN